MYLTIVIPLALLAIVLLAPPFKKLYFLLPYLYFSIGPILTYFGVIGVLTGFNDGELSESYTFGITFYTVYIAYNISKRSELIKKNPLNFIFSIINPIYLFTGPIPTNSPFNIRRFKLKRVLKIFNIVNYDLIIGFFFAIILAPTLVPYFYLKSSTNIIDIFLFGLLFEIYVYFNFAGYSMIAWVLIRLIGLKAPRNFKQPLGANSIIDYWQRWHISLSIILKELLFVKAKPIFGLYGAIFIVFINSALWHGISFNFILWGFFHATLWYLSYYLHKFNFKIFNYIIFVFGVVIGRIIFSENDSMILLSKLYKIINFTKWNDDSVFVILELSLRESINLLLIAFLVAWEFSAARMGFLDRDYNHLKSPIISTLILVYTCLSFIGFNGEPIYGNR